jgi:hypothetical protein
VLVFIQNVMHLMRGEHTSLMMRFAIS